MQNHNFYMKKCLKLAKKGEGKVSPNPLVGAIVLDENGEIVGMGYHEKYGEAHAEVNAIKKAGNKAKNGTIYVSLEPCSHYGKTPPCADLIIKSGIKKVIIGMQDPNPKVAGNGIKKLQNAGIEVIVGILENECKKINEIFIKHITTKKPFVTIKTAATIDGKIATRTGSSKWITSSKARNEVQTIRNTYDAILTGSGTVLKDNPSLTCRKKSGRNPIRVIIDSQFKTCIDSKVYKNDNTRVILAVSENLPAEKLNDIPEHIDIIKCPLVNNKINLEFLINELYKKNIFSILVEAGGTLNGAFLKQNLVDKIYLFTAPKLLGDKNAKNWVEGFDIDDISECLNFKYGQIKKFAPDIMTEIYI